MDHLQTNQNGWGLKALCCLVFESLTITAQWQFFQKYWKKDHLMKIYMLWHSLFFRFLFRTTQFENKWNFNLLMFSFYFSTRFFSLGTYIVELPTTLITEVQKTKTTFSNIPYFLSSSSFNINLIRFN